MRFSENLDCRASSLGPIYCEVRAFKPEPRLVPPLGNTSRISLVALINLQVVLPIPIDAKLYKNLVNDDDITIGKLAFIGNTFVGGITARFESSPSAKKLYIMTLGCFAQFRRRGVATKLLNDLLSAAQNRSEPVAAAFLHVDVSNDEAVGFYSKLGFEVVETQKNFYRRIFDEKKGTFKSADALVLEKRLSP